MKKFVYFFLINNIMFFSQSCKSNIEEASTYSVIRTITASQRTTSLRTTSSTTTSFSMIPSLLCKF